MLINVENFGLRIFMHDKVCYDKVEITRIVEGKIKGIIRIIGLSFEIQG